MKLPSVWHFRGIFNVNLLRAYYDTNITERDKMIKACDALGAVRENQILTLIAQQR